MNDKTDFHAIVARALDFDHECALELACRPYSGFTLGGMAITEPDLLHVAQHHVLTDQLNHILNHVTEMLEHIEGVVV